MNYTTQAGLNVKVHKNIIEYPDAIAPIIEQLTEYRGALFASGFEFPERYSRWDIGFVNPPLVITAVKRDFMIEALNDRGLVLLAFIKSFINTIPAIENLKLADDCLTATVKTPSQHFPEELRSKQDSIFSVLRAIIQAFSSSEDENLGFYGAFGYDLAFQFEPLTLHQNRNATQRDLVLYLPDEIYLVDHQKNQAIIKQYDFDFAGQSTQALPRSGERVPYQGQTSVAKPCDHEPGEYANIVKQAKEYFKRGDLFEVVPGRTFYEPCPDTPSTIFKRLRKANPAPYASFINLGEKEYLVGASPEMFVRVNGSRIETCPISGTVKRGKDAIEDAAQILTLLNSEKDASELTMCTDVDRNDKSRVCVPGSVRVIGRRQIEMYSRVIHTVDHVEGQLREGFDALDGFLSHTWVVTVTGAPKIWAMQFIEEHERSPRCWYGGAIGWLGFDGNINTGLTLRTIRIKEGVAELRAGATLLYDSDPDAEEEETALKASAFLAAIRGQSSQTTPYQAEQTGLGKNIVLIDHQDSFVHTLANYFRQSGATVTTLRNGFELNELTDLDPDLIVLSPGPGKPSDFNVAKTIDIALELKLPIFGVCLGLQSIVEYFGGRLNTLAEPVHGKPSTIEVKNGKLFQTFPEQFRIGRYHSLYADETAMPSELKTTAISDDGIIMAIEHQNLPIAAVQFHPESILSMHDNLGLKMITQAIRVLCE